MLTIFFARVHVGTRSRPQRSSKVACVLFDSSDEADTPPRARVKQQTKKRKQSIYCGSPTKRSKKPRPTAQQSILALNTRSSLKQLFNAMMGLTDRQKDAIKKMGFGGLIGLSVNDIPEVDPRSTPTGRASSCMTPDIPEKQTCSGNRVPPASTPNPAPCWEVPMIRLSASPAMPPVISPSPSPIRGLYISGSLILGWFFPVKGMIDEGGF
ncbi:hypothetical protein Hanom_Chr06g00501751 [Helianthus anomalus]